MPPKTSPHFLGLQLSVDALRAVIVDEQLELVGSEHVDFDLEFPEYQYVLITAYIDVPGPLAMPQVHAIILLRLP